MRDDSHYNEPPEIDCLDCLDSGDNCSECGTGLDENDERDIWRDSMDD